MMGERRTRKTPFVCERCQPEGANALLDVNLMAFNPSGNSTEAPPQTQQEDPKDKEIRELKEMVKRLEVAVME